MKKLLVIGVAAMLITSCTKKSNTFQLEGEIAGIKEGKAILKSYNRGEYKSIDTAKIVDGEFVFKGTVAEPELYLIFVEGKQGPISLFVENADIEIEANSDSLENAIIKGSKVNIPWVSFNQGMPMKAESYKLKEDFLVAQQSGDMTKMNELRDEYNKIVEQQKAYYEKFIWDNTNSVVAAYLAVNYAPSLEIEKLKELIAKFKSGAAAQSKHLALIEKSYQEMEKMAMANLAVAIGKEAPDFSFTNLKGEAVTLSSLKGKVVLLDFWASWCKPCRLENPNVVAINKKFGSKQFVIVSISIDNEEGLWKEAIKNDDLTWINHAWDKTGDISRLYAVQSIPHTILIGKDGVILHKNLRGLELETKLKALL